MQSTCKSPVAFIIFNRPEVTERVFAAIRAARPPVLFLIADGPRPNVPADEARCAAYFRVGLLQAPAVAAPAVAHMA